MKKVFLFFATLESSIKQEILCLSQYELKRRINATLNEIDGEERGEKKVVLIIVATIVI